MSATEQLPELMTVEAFLVWEPDDLARYELFDGAAVAMAPTSNAQGLLQSELARLIGNHLWATRPGCAVVINPGVIPNVRPKINLRIPDVGVSCVPVLGSASSLPEPVLLAEILSPSNQSVTMMNVWAYTSLPSVQEILIVHSDRIAADLLRRSADGTWPDRTTPATDGMLDLASIDFRVTLHELYAPTGLA